MSHTVDLRHVLSPLRRWLLIPDAAYKPVGGLLMVAAVLAVLLVAV